MSIHHALLALLSVGPATTYDLRKQYDAAMGHVRPLNMGQASATLSRLQRDGRVVRTPSRGSDLTQGQWQLTEAGRGELDSWWAGAISRAQPDRHDLVIKFAIAATIPGVDIPALLQAQRDATLSAMHDATRVRRGIDAADLAARLVLDHHLITLDAELRWLNEIEAELEQAAEHRPPTPSPTTPPLAAPSAAQPVAVPRRPLPRASERSDDP